MNESVPSQWNCRKANTALRRERVARQLRLEGKRISQQDIVQLLELVIEPHDRVCIEGNNQKQAQVLARSLCSVDPGRIHGLHMVQSAVSIDAHLDVFEKKIARKLDCAYAGPQRSRLAAMVSRGAVELGAIHTYLELYARYFVDLTPRVALIAAEKADIRGNLYTGPNTEETPLIVEATKGRQGIVIVQVDEIAEHIPRVDIPGDWIDYVVKTDEPCRCSPLFTRDPARISEKSILMAMIAIKGIYGPLKIQSLNHGIGYDTAAIELLLPTYAAELGLAGKMCTRWLLNPHPTLIPAIESGMVKSVYCFGSEPGMEGYIAARPDVFFTGPDGTLRSNRVYAQLAGFYGADMFIGSTLEIDQYGNSSTATGDSIVGFGGAPNLGANAAGRRHTTGAWSEVGMNCPMLRNLNGAVPAGKRIVVQIVPTSRNGTHTFVERLSAWDLAEKTGLDLPPVMIYGSEITHLVTEAGLAHLYRCETLERRRACIAAISGVSPLKSFVNAAAVNNLRRQGLVQYPEDLGIDPEEATRDLLAARSLQELAEISGGLYVPPGTGG
jgi:malonate decarboxylase alpha subunit